MCDIYITPYLNVAQSTSGTLAYAFGSGKAVISTPYWHAQELLADGAGVLVPFGDSTAMARAVINLLEDEKGRNAMRKRAYLIGREMTWARTAGRYMRSFEQARRGPNTQTTRRLAVRTLAEERFELPELRLDHLLRLSDSTGIAQHAIYTLPDRQHGYCTDDNARSLIAAVLVDELEMERPELARLATTYAGFLQYAFNSGEGRFRNFMSYDRRWLDEVGSEDSHGRALWALGTCVGRSTNRELQAWAHQLFQQALPAVPEMSSPRAWCFALLGIYEYFRRLSGDRAAAQTRDILTQKLIDLYDAVATDEWPWFEDILSYDNARFPHVMILSGRWASNPRAFKIGLNSLRWLVDLQKAPEGHFQPIGSGGFYRRGGPRAVYDQQPIEAHATISACLEAYRDTSDPRWHEEARIAFEWFLGRNDLGLAIYDAKSGGCCDGLHIDRVNQNQGAESTLAYLLALCEMELLEQDVKAFQKPTENERPPGPSPRRRGIEGTHVKVTRTGIVLKPDPARVLFRPFTLLGDQRPLRIISRVLALPEEEAKELLAQVLAEFRTRHQRLRDYFLVRFEAVKHYLPTDRPLSEERKLLIGAYFTHEYSLEAAALFNPSVVVHPDQKGVAPGAVRFVVSLRATGEGHISSITFRTGTIDALGKVQIDAPTRYVTAPEHILRPSYDKVIFRRKLQELGIADTLTEAILANLQETFTIDEISQEILYLRRHAQHRNTEFDRTADRMLNIAKANYEVVYRPEQPLSERVIVPHSPNESNGIEDARFVHFTEEDGTCSYVATYTAYDGRVIIPQLLETRDFLHFRISTLNGPEVQNKGMALFPRRIRGHFAMLGRQDGENLYIMYSDDLHFWHAKEPLLKPSYPWEFLQIGNCGSPIETEKGWLVLSHGVGPMRKYSIGAFMLDLDDPGRVIARLPHPLLSPDESEREGYVPNVVYSCGGMVHNGILLLPYAMSDTASSFATIPLDELLAAMEPVVEN